MEIYHKGQSLKLEIDTVKTQFMSLVKNFDSYKQKQASATSDEIKNSTRAKIRTMYEQRVQNKQEGTPAKRCRTETPRRGLVEAKNFTCGTGDLLDTPKSDRKLRRSQRSSTPRSSHKAIPRFSSLFDDEDENKENIPPPKPAVSEGSCDRLAPDLTLVLGHDTSVWTDTFSEASSLRLKGVSKTVSQEAEDEAVHNISMISAITNICTEKSSSDKKSAVTLNSTFNYPLHSTIIQPPTSPIPSLETDVSGVFRFPKDSTKKQAAEGCVLHGQCHRLPPYGLDEENTFRSSRKVEGDSERCDYVDTPGPRMYANDYSCTLIDDLEPCLQSTPKKSARITHRVSKSPQRISYSRAFSPLPKAAKAEIKRSVKKSLRNQLLSTEKKTRSSQNTYEQYKQELYRTPCIVGKEKSPERELVESGKHHRVCQGEDSGISSGCASSQDPNYASLPQAYNKPPVYSKTLSREQKKALSKRMKTFSSAFHDLKTTGKLQTLAHF